MRVHPLLPILAVAAAAVAAGCARTVDLTKEMETLDVSSGWYDVGPVDGQNKMVPGITFRLKNNSDQTLKVLQLNVAFRRANGPPGEFEAVFIPAIGTEGLAPGATTEPLTAKSKNGYTGSDPLEQMMKNSAFVDVTASISAKYGSHGFQVVSEHPITRALLTQ
jgi:hypothetical protein